MTFDATAWAEKCAAAAHCAAAGTGHSDIAWSKNLHHALAPHLAKFEPAHHAEALAIATKWGYQELAEICDDNVCAHGIEPKFCPVGCGDRAAEMEWEAASGHDYFDDDAPIPF